MVASFRGRFDTILRMLSLAQPPFCGHGGGYGGRRGVVTPAAAPAPGSACTLRR